jgi:hypothetical protein
MIMIMLNYLDDLKLTAAYMLELKESDPERHKRISDYYFNILKDIEPDSRMGPSIQEFILDIVNDYPVAAHKE